MRAGWQSSCLTTNRQQLLMKKLMVTGAMLGFGGGILLGILTEGATWPGIIWRASVSAFGAGLLIRWLGRVWIDCLRQTQAERLATLETKQAVFLSTSKD
jgi:hypothetical protein